MRIKSRSSHPAALLASVAAFLLATLLAQPLFAQIVVQSSDTATPVGGSVPLVLRTGTWTQSSFNPQRYGSSYWHDGNAGKGTKTARYTPLLPEAGTYEVSLWWAGGSNYATNTPIDIAYSGSAPSGSGASSTLLIDQRSDGGHWITLGRYPFLAGQSGSVTLRTGGTDGFVLADAV
jgi:hypothetical protein